MLADAVLTGAAVITNDPALPRAEAVAIAGGRIAAVGTREEMDALVGPSTRVIDPGGGAVLPGFQDAHNHACFAGRYLLTLDLHDLHTREEYLDAVAAYAAANPDAEWIFGGGWALPAFPGGRPRRDVRSPMRSPAKSEGAYTSTLITGSRIVGLARVIVMHRYHDRGSGLLDHPQQILEAQIGHRIDGGHHDVNPLENLFLFRTQQMPDIA